MFRTKVVLILVIVAAVTIVLYLTLGRQKITNEELRFSISYPRGWEVVEENNPEKMRYNEMIVFDKIADCGFDCAAAGKLVITKSKDEFLTVYVFGNKENVSLKDYLKIFFKNTELDSFERIEMGGVEGLRETMGFDDGRKTTNLYFSRNNLVYWLSKDLHVSNQQEFNRISNELDMIMKSFKFI